MNDFRADVKAAMQEPEPEPKPDPDEEDKDMTQEKFNEMFASAMQAYLAEIDEKTVNDWAKESWGKLVSEGVFDGTKPQAAMTREQAAVVLDRLEQEEDADTQEA